MNIERNKMKLRLTIFTIVIVLFSVSLHAQGLYGKKTTTTTAMDEGAKSGIFKAPMEDEGMGEGGGRGEPNGAPKENVPIGEGIFSLVLLAGVYAVIKRKMRKVLPLLVGVLLMPTGLYAQVAIGSQTDPHSFSLLELVSQSRGLRLPQMTSANRPSATTLGSSGKVAWGLTIYNTDTQCVEFWNGEHWVSPCSSINVFEQLAITGTCGVSGARNVTVINPPSGWTVDWYSASTGGVSLVKGTTTYNTGPGTVYIVLREVATGNITAERFPVIITITCP
jgi:hypothetical protein